MGPVLVILVNPMLAVNTKSRQSTKVLTFILALFSASVSAEKLTNIMTPTEAEGYILYKSAGGYGCHTCHGLAASGYNLAGSDIRGKDSVDYQNSVNSEGVMSALKGAVSVSELEKISQTLAFFNRYPLIRILLDDHGKMKQEAPVSDNESSGVLIHVINQSLESQVADLSPWGLPSLPLDALGSAVLFYSGK